MVKKGKKNKSRKNYKKVLIRKYNDEDKESVRRIAVETLIKGEPANILFPDRKYFADFLTNYFTKKDNEHCFVAAVEGEVVGYVLSTTKVLSFWMSVAKESIKAFPRLLWNYPKYDKNARFFFNYSIIQILKGLIYPRWAGLPRRPKSKKRKLAEFHINLFRDFRMMGIGKKLYVAVENDLKKNGVEIMYGEVFTYEGEFKGKKAWYEKFGFELYDSVRNDCFKPMFPGKKLFCIGILKRI